MNICLTLPDGVVRGKQVSFFAPISSENTEYLMINDERYLFVDANNFVVKNAAGLWTSRSIVSVILDDASDPKRAYIQNPAGGRVGRKTSGGEIFGDYATNKATGFFASAFGTETKAIGEASFAHGKKIFRSGSDYIHYTITQYEETHGNTFKVYYAAPEGKFAQTHSKPYTEFTSNYPPNSGVVECWTNISEYDQDDELVKMDDGRYCLLSDYRYNEAYGTGSMAAGKGAVAYSRASKSFGYRTQTGYPASPEVAQLRPEAVLCPLPFTVSEPTEINDGDLYSEDVQVYEDYIQFFGRGGNIVYPMLSGKLRFRVSGRASYIATPGDNNIVLLIDYYASKNDDGSYDPISLDNRYDVYSEDEFVTLEAPVTTAYIKIHCKDAQSINQMSVKISDFQYFPADNKGQGAFAIGADTVAAANQSFAGGWKSKALAHAAFAFGTDNEVRGDSSASFGNGNKVKGANSLAVGKSNIIELNNSIVAGANNTVGGNQSIVVGSNNVASGKTTQAIFGIGNEADRIGQTVVGLYNIKDTDSLLVVGNGTDKDHKSNAITVGFSSTNIHNNLKTKKNIIGGEAEVGSSTDHSLVIGGEYTDPETGVTENTKATSQYNFIFGRASKATKWGAVAIGDRNTSSGFNSLATGANTEALKDNSATFGKGTKTGRSCQTVVGQYNVSSSDAFFVVGNGTSATDCKNAFQVNTDGSATLAGGLNGVYMRTWKENSNMMHIKSKFDSWSTLDKNKRQSFFVFGILCPDNTGTVGAIVQGTIMVTGDCKATWHGTGDVTILDQHAGQFTVLFPHPVFDYITVISAEKFDLVEYIT